MWLQFLTLAVGFALITYAADRFVDHAAALASSLGITPLVVGLTIVAVGSSAPELLVSCLAALAGNSGLAVGNAIGSNITNVGLVLGLSALLGGLTVSTAIRRRELPIMLVISCGVWVLLLNGVLGRTEGATLLLVFSGLVAALVWTQRRRHRAIPGETEPASAGETLGFDEGALQALVWTLLHLVVLLVASRLVVVSAVDISRTLGISDTVIGLTVIALGTSLPEVAASLAAALKGHHDLAVGNVVGSNIANLLLVLGAAALLHPPRIDPGVLIRDLPVMLALAVAVYLLPANDGGGKKKRQRVVGAALLCAYLGYVAYLALNVARS